MRRLLLAMLVSLPACGSDPGAVEITWSFPPDRSEGCGGTPEVATIRAILTEASLRYEQTIECRVGQAILISDVEEGSYALLLDALTSDGTQVYGATVTGVQVDEGKTVPVQVTLSVQPGTIRLEWSLPTNCAVDGVRDILVQAFDGEQMLHNNMAELYWCDEGFVTIEGNWIRSREYSEYSMYVYGMDRTGARTHDWADCDLIVESGVENLIRAELSPCDGGDCCPGGLCRELCPTE